jgi:hypothetical protein
MSEDEKTAKDLEREAKQAEADKMNASRSGIGTRVFVGSTRGKGSLVITWEQFDDSKPDTLPTTIEKFMEVTSVKDEPSLVNFLIAGYNESNYIAASDPLAEYVESTWPPDAQTQFRLVVRNYSRGAGVSLDDAVALIKPGFSKQFEPKK